MADENKTDNGILDLIAKEYSAEPAGGAPDGGGGGEPGAGEPINGLEPGQADGGAPQDGVVKLQEFFGGKVKTPDELQGFVERGMLYSTEVEAELTELRGKKAEFDRANELIEKGKNFNPYKNPNFFRLDKLAETRPDDVGFFQNLVFGNSKDIDLFKADLLRRHPDIFKEDPEALQSAVKKEFPHLFDDDYPPDSQEYKDDMVQLRMKASTIRKTYVDEFNAIPVPDPKAEEQSKDQQKAALAAAWEPKFQAFQSNLTKIPVFVKDEKNETDLHYFDIDIPEADRTAMITFAKNFVIKNQIPADEKSVQAVVDHVQALWVVQNLNKYNTLVAEQTAKENNTEWRKRVSNSRKPGEQGPAGNFTEDGQTQLYNTLINQKKGIRII